MPQRLVGYRRKSMVSTDDQHYFSTYCVSKVSGADDWHFSQRVGGIKTMCIQLFYQKMGPAIGRTGAFETRGKPHSQLQFSTIAINSASSAMKHQSPSYMLTRKQGTTFRPRCNHCRTVLLVLLPVAKHLKNGLERKLKFRKLNGVHAA